MLLEQNLYQTVVGFSMYFVFFFACLHTRQHHLKRFFLPKPTSFVSRSQAHLAKCNTKILMQNSSQWCLRKRRWIDVDGVYAHFLSQQQYSRVYALFLAFYAMVWVIDEEASFFHFVHKITNIRNWRCFSSSNIRTQFSHTFCNITMIFKAISQYFSALFERIYNHIRSAEGENELSVKSDMS